MPRRCPVGHVATPWHGGSALLNSWHHRALPYLCGTEPSAVLSVGKDSELAEEVQEWESVPPCPGAEALFLEVPLLMGLPKAEWLLGS